MPTLNTSSLPDLIFTVLFFFMVATHMRKVTLKVKYQVPQGTQLTRLVNKSATSYVCIGTAEYMHDKHKVYEQDGYSIQFNDMMVAPEDITRLAANEKAALHEDDEERYTVMLKADKTVKMALINKVKTCAREAGVKNIGYSANREAKNHKSGKGN